MQRLIREIAAVNAVEILKDYCNDMGCKHCVFNSNGYCQFRDHGFAPVYWDIPESYKED